MKTRRGCFGSSIRRPAGRCLYAHVRTAGSGSGRIVLNAAYAWNPPRPTKLSMLPSVFLRIRRRASADKRQTAGADALDERGYAQVVFGAESEPVEVTETAFANLIGRQG